MSVFDPISPRLNTNLFDENDKLKTSARLFILKYLDRFSGEYSKDILTVTFMGSMIGYRYAPTSDIDIVVTYVYETVPKLNWSERKKANGELLPGTQHPVNFTLVPKPPWNGYDLLEDRWLHHKPLPEEEKEINPDYDYLNLKKRQLETQVEQAYKALNTNRFRDEAKDIADIYKEIDEDRKLIYNLKIGNPRYSTENLAYKYLEHATGYGEATSKIERLMRKKK